MRNRKIQRALRRAGIRRVEFERIKEGGNENDT